MKKLIVRVAVVVAVLFAARWVLNGILDVRLMNHFNECHAELGVAEKIHVPPGEQRDELLERYGQCVRDKGTSVDNRLRDTAIRQIIEELKK